MSENIPSRLPSRRRWLQFRLSTLLIYVTAFSAIFAAIGWALSRHRNTIGLNDESRCRANLVMIASAMRDYHADYGSFPPAFLADDTGRPLHSWRALILPYIDGGRQIYSQYRFDEPWDGPNNQRLLTARPRIFHCPADNQTAKDATKANYFVVSGSATVFPDGKSVPLGDLSDSDATILVVEAVGLGVDWLAPNDLDIASLNLQPGTVSKGISSRHVHGCNVALANGNPKVLMWPWSEEDVLTLLSIRATPSQKRAAMDR